MIRGIIINPVVQYKKVSKDYFTFQSEGESFLVISIDIFSPLFEYLSKAEDKIFERFFPLIYGKQGVD